MSTSQHKMALAVPAAAAAAALILSMTGCSAQSSNSDGPITLKLSTFGNFGYSDEMLKKYEDSHPGVTIEHNIAPTGEEARTDVFTKLAAGSGLPDVQGVEIGWTVDLRQYADKFVPVEPDKYGDWVDYQKVPVTTDDGKLFAYGVATGPEAMCYRSDMLAAAGLPSDPNAVAELLGSSWDDYYAAGEKYVAGGGEGAWYDSALSVFSSQVEQMPNPYEADDGTIVADGPELEKVFKSSLESSSDLSAKVASFTDDWAAATGNNGFATMPCPSWMLGLIEGNSPGVTGWNVANTFPGGGGNWGGSYLAVPTQSQHPKEASELASWLTAPEQQIAAFKVAGPFPSRLDAYDVPDLIGYANPFFSDAPVGQIFTDRSNAITNVAYKGVKFAQIDALAVDAVTRAETGSQSIDDSWDQFVSEVDKLK